MKQLDPKINLSEGLTIFILDISQAITVLTQGFKNQHTLQQQLY